MVTWRSRFRCFRTSPEIIRLAVMMSICFSMSLRNVEDLLHERGDDLWPKTARFRWNRFGSAINRQWECFKRYTYSGVFAADSGSAAMARADLGRIAGAQSGRTALSTAVIYCEGHTRSRGSRVT